MKAPARLRSWMRSAFHRSRLEHQLDDELRFHIDSYAADLQARGLSPEEAYRRARREFGGVETRKEECREALGLRLVDEVSDSPCLRTKWLR